jgi:hypothetical protein
MVAPLFVGREKSIQAIEIDDLRPYQERRSGSRPFCRRRRA